MVDQLLCQQPFLKGQIGHVHISALFDARGSGKLGNQHIGGPRASKKHGTKVGGALRLCIQSWRGTWSRGTAAERRSLAGNLSLSHALPSADG